MLLLNPMSLLGNYHRIDAYFRKRVQSRYIKVAPGVPSINEPAELQEVLGLLSGDSEQQHLLKATTN